MSEQYVCTVCGYNMIGSHPDECPFCHVDKSKFLTSEECSASHFVVENPVNAKVSRVGTTPKLGLEHAAYRIKTDDKVILIDCPCCFDETFEHVDTILFTHPHFIGAANLYRDRFKCDIQIHKLDLHHSLAKLLSYRLSIHSLKICG